MLSTNSFTRIIISYKFHSTVAFRVAFVLGFLGVKVTRETKSTISVYYISQLIKTKRSKCSIFSTRKGEGEKQRKKKLIYVYLIW